jgi:hypothetical protein
MEKEHILKDALEIWSLGYFDQSINILRNLVAAGYEPAYPEFLKRIWGDGNYYSEFSAVLEDGIRRNFKDCVYINLWKDFSNRPADDEYWERLNPLVDAGQKDALLAQGLKNFYDAKTDDEVVAAINMMVTALPLHTAEMNLSMIWATKGDHLVFSERGGHIRRIMMKNIPEDVLYNCIMKPFVPMRPHRPSFDIPDICVNHVMTNEDFNAQVFSPKRMLERRLIEKNDSHVLNYSEIISILMELISASDIKLRVMEGLTKNAWSLSDEEHSAAESRHSVYLMKETSDRRWMTLRLGDHTSNTGDYYKYRRMFLPSTRDNANMCIMFHGDTEQNQELKYSFRFRAETSDPCVTVRDEDYQLYEPFMYTLVHYIPGLIEDIRPLADAIIKWFKGDGLIPFENPYLDEPSSPLARINGGIVNIETWDIKYKRRRKEQEAKKQQDSAGE